MVERRTPLYDFHARSARSLVKGGGDYVFPTSYTSPVEEHLNVRKNVGVQDLSTMGEVDIKRPGAERLVRRLLVNEVADGYELYTPADQASVLWEHLLKTGREFNLEPYGVAAMQSLRIEKAFPLYGPDIDHRPTGVGPGCQSRRQGSRLPACRCGETFLVRRGPSPMVRRRGAWKAWARTI